MSETIAYKTIATGQEAARKFDYFITALTGAVFSYLVNHLSPEKLGWNHFTMNVVSLLLLAWSIYLGFRRIETHHTILFTNGQLLECSEEAGNMMKVMVEGSPAYNTGTGEHFSPQKAQMIYDRNQKAISSIESSLKTAIDKSASLYKWRNVLLALGFVSLLASKVAEPYLQ
jgi:hypothetical protein